MRKCVGVLLLVGLLASVASADTWNWEGDVSNGWSNASNWNDGTSSPPATVPHTAGESMYIPLGTQAVNADMTDTMGLLMVSRGGAGGGAVVNLGNSAVTLNVVKASGELVSVCYTDSTSGTINVSAGRLNVYRPSVSSGAGEIRLNHVYAGTCVGNLNLSGTGIVDVEYLNKGDKAGGGNFAAIGGTLVARNIINKFGVVSENAGYGFRLGGARLEVASFADRNNEIGSVKLGDGQSMDFIMDSTSKVKFDLGSAGGVGGTNWDLLTSRGNFTIDGQLLVNFMVAPTVGDHWDVWKILAGYENTFSGSGSFDTLPSNIQASWVDTGAGTDILRLTYVVPEPATIALLGLGLLAIRRNRK